MLGSERLVWRTSEWAEPDVSTISDRFGRWLFVGMCLLRTKHLRCHMESFIERSGSSQRTTDNMLPSNDSLWI